MNSSEQKPSRYRSVRNANAQAAAAASDPASDPSSNDDNAAGTVNRTRSRYHRKPQQQSQVQSPPLPSSPDPALSPQPTTQWSVAPQSSKSQDRQNAHTGARLVSAESRERVLTPRAEAERRRRLEDNSASRQSESSRGRERSAYSGEDGLHKSDSARRHDSPMFDGTVPRQKTTESQAPQQILATTVDIHEEKAATCFSGLFGRKKTNMVQQRPEKAKDVKKDEPQFIKHGGGGIVPGIDAPKSAVNSGERRVLIECNRNSMQFPVDTTTSASDLVQSAANCFSDVIDPKTFVLMEYFSKVGVQRPLRRYEHVREVMNSWDDDRQNSLILVPATASGSDPALLHSSSVPLVKPTEKTFVIYYSQKVGKWDRRHIIVRTDGQVVAKKNSTASDKDAMNVCHLSDFDIYTPTPRQLSKKIRPPKKLCFAIKSQQKTNMFETTTDFVHFFCTSEKEEAIAFYTAVQTWRSWYLVNVKGEGKKQPAKQPDPFKASPTRGQSTKKIAHNRDQSMESHYQLGSFKPMIDTEKFDFQPPAAEEEPVKAAKPIARASSKRERKRTPPSMPQEQLGDNEPLVKLLDKRASVDEARSSGTFATGGLLGRTYSQRQRDHAAKEASATAAQPFTNGPSLLNQTDALRPATSDTNGIRRNPSTRQPADHDNRRGSVDIGRRPSTRRPERGSVDLGRSTSTRVPPKPLVDLTPTYRAPPQHQRKGRGYVPPSAEGGLINSVPSPEDPLGLPPSTDWRGRNATHELHSSSGHDRGTSAGRSRARSTSRSKGSAQPAVPQAARFQNTAAYAALTGAPEPAQVSLPRERQLSGGGNGGLVDSGRMDSVRGERNVSGGAFVPGGLLEHAAGGWGAGDKGRGVQGSSHARQGGGGGKPLVDLSEQGVYGKGSLLERQAGREAIKAPVIDRDP
ncbi:PH domain-containing protein 2 [Elsinoe australis]|uniref:PH domain-containing protein 2 n=1 Tax=Elsinoe australis TaxID=40998 RepID=A0A4U7BCY2_9PEZI|nr:PH domain-containing protein 2 [Elsinoe australis]